MLAGLGLGLALAVGGCATTSSSREEVLPAAAVLINQTSKTIARVDYQECGAPADSWATLPLAAVPSGGRAQFQLPTPCVNLKAVYPDGRTAGTQTGVRRDFPFQWTLS